jgi:DNA replication licensing factor MCM7
MKQQTMAISKVGITTMLNVCMSILAVANSLCSHYNPKVSPVETIDLPVHLCLLFLLLDNPSHDNYEWLAQHITYVHMYSKHPDPEHELLDLVLVW